MLTIMITSSNPMFFTNSFSIDKITRLETLDCDMVDLKKLFVRFKFEKLFHKKPHTHIYLET